MNADQEVFSEISVKGGQAAKTHVCHVLLLSVYPLEHNISTTFKLVDSVDSVGLDEFKCQTICHLL